jgi:LDH2 family malate/lactate/ureidoglycolate dehydrogenase
VSTTIRVPYAELLSRTSDVFRRLGVPDERAVTAATALCYGDLTGHTSHGLFNLSRLYLPLLRDGRADPRAEPTVTHDLGACAVVDSRRALGLWAAAEAMDAAVERASRHGIGLVSVRAATHIGCAGFHALRAIRRGMIGVVASNCGGQRIVRPPGGTVAMLGTNPLSVAAPALADRPFVLDMSTTVAPTGKIRVAERRGEPIPPGWLVDSAGAPVTDPGAFDRGEGYLRWLGGDPETGAYKGFGLALVVELLAALLPGAAVGPDRAALAGNGRPHGRDDDIGLLLLAIAPEMIQEGFAGRAQAMFGALTECPAADPGEPVRYPGWWEGERARANLRLGVPLPATVHAELVALGRPERTGAVIR